MIRTIALLCLLTLAPIVAAQEAPHEAQPTAEPTARQAMAKVIAEAMVPTSRNDYGRDWDALSVRISRHLHWHLAPPDQAADITSATGIRRNGWIEDDKEQIGVSAYGFQAVDSLTFALSPRFASTEPEEDDTVIAALTAIGVTPSPAPSPPSFSGIAETVWDLDADGRDRARLTRSILCTPEGSAAARMCGATYERVLKQ